MKFRKEIVDDKTLKYMKEWADGTSEDSPLKIFETIIAQSITKFLSSASFNPDEIIEEINNLSINKDEV